MSTCLEDGPVEIVCCFHSFSVKNGDSSGIASGDEPIINPDYTLWYTNHIKIISKLVKMTIEVVRFHHSFSIKNSDSSGIASGDVNSLLLKMA